MKLKEWYKELQELIEQQPEILELECYYAKDTEGNSYEKVYYSPVLGNIDDDMKFLYCIDDNDKKNATAILLN